MVCGAKIVLVDDDYYEMKWRMGTGLKWKVGSELGLFRSGAADCEKHNIVIESRSWNALYFKRSALLPPDYEKCEWNVFSSRKEVQSDRDLASLYEFTTMFKNPHEKLVTACLMKHICEKGMKIFGIKQNIFMK